MATHRDNMLDGFLSLSPNIYWSKLKDVLTLGSAAGESGCYVIADPAGGGDHGLYGRYRVPKIYVGAPKIIVRGILDGTPANNLALGIQFSAHSDSDTIDVALGTEDVTNTSTWTGYADEDVIEIEIDPTNATFAVDEDMEFFFFWDDSQASPYSGNFLLTGLRFEFSDA